jgi:hypothetical protein
MSSASGVRKRRGSADKAKSPEKQSLQPVLSSDVCDAQPLLLQKPAAGVSWSLFSSADNW